MEEEAILPPCSDTLLLCCLCKSLLRDPVQLSCLHSCCRQCLSSPTDTDKSNHVTCGSCRIVTEAGDAEPNTFLERLVSGFAAMAKTNSCAICKINDDADVLALVWCGSCRQSLCGDCMPAHSRYNRNHCTQSLDELKSLKDSLLRFSLTPSCSVHKRPLEIVCFTCEKAKCVNCWAACNKGKHMTTVIDEEAFVAGLESLKSAMSSMEDEILKKSVVFEKCKSMLKQLRSERDDRLAQIQLRKRHIIDSVERIYQEIELATRSMYDSMHKEAECLAAVAASIEKNLNFFRHYVNRLVETNSNCDLWNQQKILRNRLISLSAELDKLNASMDDPKPVCIEQSLPENLDYVLKSWIGEPRVFTAGDSSRPQSQLFCAPSGYVQLPSECYDVALTQDGNILLAARIQGLFECCTRGHVMCQWRPPKKINGDEDDVDTVYALRDGRVAVGVFCAQMIVLLRRITIKNTSRWKWIEERRLDKLQSPAWRLSADGDVLAVAQWRWDQPYQSWEYGPKLQLMRLSSGKQQAALIREYDIGSIALTVHVLITSSNDKVVLNCDREVYVIDAHDRSGDVRLWRYELLNDDEVIEGIFPDFVGRALYVALQMTDGSSGRVAEISLEKGSEQRDHVLCFDDRLLPECLSVDHSGTVVAALCNDTKSDEQRTLTLFLITQI